MMLCLSYLTPYTFLSYFLSLKLILTLFHIYLGLIMNKFKHPSGKYYSKFYSQTKSSFTYNPSKFWSFIRKNSIAKTLFSNHFNSVYSHTVVPNPINLIGTHPYILPNHINLFIDDVYHGLINFWHIKCIGSDRILGDFLFHLRDVISYLLTVLFYNSYP